MGESAITVRRAAAEGADATLLMEELSRMLLSITGSSGRASFDAEQMQQPGCCFALAYDPHGNPVGCGAFRPLEEGIAEVKRIYARDGARGVGSALLAFLEAEARRLGYRQVWLETRLVNLRAVRFYLAHGYREIAAYGDYIGKADAVCLGKTLGDSMEG
ncbi:GNAT family N-acetyltransferase [Nissabacter sp. SGAir0207]|uniref:GNAT family N-acetyltransferase n=1 Tax=Nissabacter sp. SGAir0207 TaxID=2126321 RepID=UPI0010CCF4F7|nr:GNAT family N-acetyltransferase [Nissabacter sp. SGAir0207]QCR36662.1 GNAT family N-acetyltransferase [Nissabacter sp. SGAir0207]